MKDNKREKHWMLTYERANQIYELVSQTLDSSTWDLPIKSEPGEKIPFDDFLQKARKRLNPHNREGNYAPSLVAEDALYIIENIKLQMENVRNRLEDSFRSLLVVNEDMDEFITHIEEDMEEKDEYIDELKQANEKLVELNEELKRQIKVKNLGIAPLVDIIQIRVKEIISLYKEFVKTIGDGDKMDSFLPIFEREVDNTITLINLKQQQVLDSDLYKKEVQEVYEDVKEEEVEDEPVVEVPDEFSHLPKETYDKAHKLVGEPEEYIADTWNVNMKRAIKCVQDGTKYKPVMPKIADTVRKKK